MARTAGRGLMAPLGSLRGAIGAPGKASRWPSMWGRLTTCAAVDYRRRSAADAGVPSGSGRLTIGRSLPSCPTWSQAISEASYPRLDAAGVGFQAFGARQRGD